MVQYINTLYIGSYLFSRSVINVTGEEIGDLFVFLLKLDKQLYKYSGSCGFFYRSNVNCQITWKEHYEIPCVQLFQCAWYPISCEILVPNQRTRASYALMEILFCCEGMLPFVEPVYFNLKMFKWFVDSNNQWEEYIVIFCFC